MLPKPGLFAWAAYSLPFVVLNSNVHLWLFACFGAATEEQNHYHERMRRECGGTNLRPEAREDFEKLFSSASNLYHQRINFSLVANAALIAGVSQVYDEPRPTICLSLVGLAMSYASMLSIWVIGARSHFAFHVLETGRPAYTAYRQVVSTGTLFPTGKCLLEHVMPWLWTTTWVVIAVGAATGTWSKW